MQIIENILLLINYVIDVLAFYIELYLTMGQIMNEGLGVVPHTVH